MPAIRLAPPASLAAAFAAAFAAALAAVLAADAAHAGPLDAYLPKGGIIEGHVVRLAVAPEDQAVDRRFRTAVAGNMDWFRRAVQGAKAGEPLPYDPRMGITEAQYQRLQHMHAVAQEGAAVTVKVTRAADGGVTFAAKDGPAAALDTVSFPPDEKAARTPYGALDIFNTIHQADAQAPLGAWSGAEWARVAPEGSDAPSAKIAFGRRADGGGLMYYQVAPTKDQKEQSLVVFYKLD